MAKTMNTCRIHKVNDVIGRVVPEDSAFWDIGVPPVVETWLWLDVGRSESQPESRDPQISMFSSSGFPQPRRERPLPDHSSSWEKAANSSSNNALGMHFLEPVQRGLAYILQLRWWRWMANHSLEKMTLRACILACSCTTEKDCCRLVLVGQHTVLQHSVGLRRWMRFPNRRLWRQTHSITVLVSLCLYHCACLTMLVSMCLSQCCLSQCCFPMCCFFLAGFPALAN